MFAAGPKVFPPVIQKSIYYLPVAEAALTMASAFDYALLQMRSSCLDISGFLSASYTLKSTGFPPFLLLFGIW